MDEGPDLLAEDHSKVRGRHGGRFISSGLRGIPFFLFFKVSGQRIIPGGSIVPVNSKLLACRQKR